MKKVFITKVPPTGAMCKAGDWLPIQASAELDALTAKGYEFQTESEYNAVKAREQAEQSAQANAVKAREILIDGEITRARDRGVFAAKEDVSTVRAEALEMEAFRPGMGVKYLADKQPVKAQDASLKDRLTASDQPIRVQVVSEGVRELVRGFIHASEPFTKTVRQGGILTVCRNDSKAMSDAIMASRNRAIITGELIRAIEGGANFTLQDMVKAGDYVDPASNNPLGTLNSTLVLTWNLGYLKNMLPMLNDVVTSISNQPIEFGQMAKVRYITVPKYQKKTSTTAWSTAQSGNTVDVNVSLTNYNGVPIAFPETILGATVRQLHNEMKTPQLYSLGESMVYNLVNTIINGNTRYANDGSTTSTIKFGNVAEGGTANGIPAFGVTGSTLATFTADLPAYMDQYKLAGGQEPPGTSVEDLARFAWLHHSVYANLAADTNLMLNQSIWGAVAGKGGNLMATGVLPPLGNVKISKSQLVRDGLSETSDGATPPLYSVTVPATAPASVLGFAGTRNSLLFASRVPTDYTKVMPEIPSTAAVELVTEPSTGLTFMVVKYLDHAYEISNARVSLMFGMAIGDERQGFILKV